MGLLSRDEGLTAEEKDFVEGDRPLLPPEENAPRALPGAPRNAWEDHAHESLYLELLDASGEVKGRARWIAPANANASQVHQVRAVIAHEDGCSRDLATWDLPPY